MYSSQPCPPYAFPPRRSHAMVAMEIPITSLLERWLLSMDDDLRIYVLWFVDPVDLVHLSATSLVVHALIWYYRTQVWDINRFLELWFPYPESFVHQLTLTSAVISGSQVIRFFDRLPPSPDSDLDIFTRVAGVVHLGQYLFDLGFIMVTEGKKSDKYDRSFRQQVLRVTQGDKLERSSAGYNILSVFNFVIASDDEDIEPLLKVQLIVVNSDPIDFIIHSFHSSKSL
jgi:hypothetical protein